MATAVRKTTSEAKILATASELFYENGLRGVGVDQVIAESGVSKSTLYAHFRSKEDLVSAYLRVTDVSWMAQLQEHAASAGADPREQLVGLFDALLGAFDRHGFFGCPFISAAVETSLDSEARAITRAHIASRQAWLTELAEAAGATSPTQLARHIGLLIDGALAGGRLEQDRSIVEDGKAAARDAVGAACPTQSPG
ncbi:TetR/AcrR family transcriptional regulator [Plantibacter sp. YIM 135347]|uniref:TetR/AcrR family transcriptional regulator n=1 Tax=Plantibacter sp. YIM 135347 TaxID=3423919 RepID=UPI003D32D10F